MKLENYSLHNGKISFKKYISVIAYFKFINSHIQKKQEPGILR